MEIQVAQWISVAVVSRLESSNEGVRFLVDCGEISRHAIEQQRFEEKDGGGWDR